MAGKRKAVTAAAQDTEINNVLAEANAIPAGFVEIASGVPLAKPGDIVTGVLRAKSTRVMGKGKKKKNVNVYRIETDTGAQVEVLGAWQIDAALSDMAPDENEVWIERGEQVQVGANRVNKYRIATRKL